MTARPLGRYVRPALIAGAAALAIGGGAFLWAKSSAKAQSKNAPLVVPPDKDELHVPRVIGITLDGDSDDWASAGARTGLFVTEDGKAARPESQARAVWADGYLYMLLYAADEDIEVGTAGPDGPLWLKDAYQLTFTSPDGAERHIESLSPGHRHRRHSPAGRDRARFLVAERHQGLEGDGRDGQQARGHGRGVAPRGGHPLRVAGDRGEAGRSPGFHRKALRQAEEGRARVRVGDAEVARPRVSRAARPKFAEHRDEKVAVVSELVHDGGKQDAVVPKFAHDGGKQDAVVPEFAHDVGKQDAVVPEFADDVGKQAAVVPKFAHDVGKQDAVVDKLAHDVGKQDAVVDKLAHDVGKQDAVVPKLAHDGPALAAHGYE